MPENQPKVNIPFSPEVIAVMKDDPVFPQLGHQSFPEKSKQTTELGNKISEDQGSPNYPE
ncbi:hypothetical protein E2K98_14855 [Bacillus salipaludis]|uniref:Uncharacterized protein n=1 Tax=Bacillus salipaludis TaxID=2547811 RepID=A0A4R5VR80_9BACI|nr:hypothetical protein [Bacillus salipaludis]MDQ6598461.1 hypothetical protein [Bacillus salipaludis]TDK60984.1 hypothetical protein E2K98_14855 [Bacillus salipaludis]